MYQYKHKFRPITSEDRVPTDHLDLSDGNFPLICDVNSTVKVAVTGSGDGDNTIITLIVGSQEYYTILPECNKIVMIVADSMVDDILSGDNISTSLLEVIEDYGLELFCESEFE